MKTALTRLNNGLQAEGNPKYHQTLAIALAMEHCLTCEQFRLDYGTFMVEKLRKAVEDISTKE
jgi:hypothetical protein